MTAPEINRLIQTEKADTNLISDGYHTFGELYEHRIALFIALCRKMRGDAWKSRLTADGAAWEGWFLLGLFIEKGKQITYHLPDARWDDLADVPTRDRAPEWDGHNSADVLQRLKTL